MDNIKQSFQKVKQDINLLKDEINFLKNNLIETREKMVKMCDLIIHLNKKLSQEPQETKETSQINPPTDKQPIPTDPTHSSTHSTPFNSLKPQNPSISIGNQGVPTDKQTDKQTDIPTQNQPKNNQNSMDNALKILNSLDDIKKEIRLQFKRLTDQEIVVFSTIYQLEEEQGNIDYKTVSRRLNLSESSIRDYVGRLIKKGIPVEKTKINNKNIQLSISSKLKKIASLPTILQLREI